MKNKSYDIAIYVISMIFIVFSGMIAKMISPFFDFAGYGAMRAFFDELFTSLIWLVGIIAMFIVFLKKYKYNILSDKDTRGEMLPLKRIIFIGVIVSACVLIISAQIGFQVKPFYDLGEKFDGYDMFNNLGIFMRNAVKCIWIVIMIKASHNLVETVLKKEKFKYPVCGIVLMLTVGIYDLIMGVNNLPVTYFLLYIVYGWLYLLVEKNSMKAFLLILFVLFF